MLLCSLDAPQAWSSLSGVLCVSAFVAEYVKKHLPVELSAAAAGGACPAETQSIAGLAMSMAQAVEQSKVMNPWPGTQDQGFDEGHWAAGRGVHEGVDHGSGAEAEGARCEGEGQHTPNCGAQARASSWRDVPPVHVTRLNAWGCFGNGPFQVCFVWCCVLRPWLGIGSQPRHRQGKALLNEVLGWQALPAGVCEGAHTHTHTHT
jgi:hypothetical protein